MKKLLFVILLHSLALPALAQNQKGPKLTVYYFHITERCETCKTIEIETKKLLNEAFANELKNKTIVFKAINVDLPENNDIKVKYMMYGSGLLLVKHLQKTEKTVELTNIAFQFVPGNIVRFHKELKEEIKKLL
jgi:thiol-disulfide isomerase/thioredoxin